MRRIVVGVALLGALLAPVAGAVPAEATGAWTWPVVGPVIRGFDPPGSPYGPGHRGVDIAASSGTVVRAPAPGVVTFAGQVAGQRFVTIDHGGGVLSTCSFLSGLLVHAGDLVAQGQPIGLSGSGHPGDTLANLHFGVRVDGQYVDPMGFLGPASVADLIHLAPLGAG